MIPFARAKKEEGQGWIKSVYVSPAVLDTLKQGGNITDTIDRNMPRVIEYFRRLPSSISTRAWPHHGVENPENDQAEKEETEKEATVEIGLIKNRRLEEIGFWWQAVSGIAFGGLDPQTTKELKDAVIFTLSGLPEVMNCTISSHGTLPRDSDGEGYTCARELEQLVDKVHRQTENLNLFEQYVADRVRWDDANFSIKCRNT